MLGVAPSRDADECWVDYVDAGGVEHHLPLRESVMVGFEDAAPVRRFPSYRGQRSFPGWWWFATTGTHVGFESWLERDWLMAFDSSRDVVRVAAQPFWLSWPTASGAKRHAPDFFLRRRDGGAVVVDVRADDRIEAGERVVFERTAALCASAGWGYRRVGAMPATRAANLRWLSGYRHPRCRRPGLVVELTAAFAQPRGLSDGVEAVGDPIAVLPTLFHLLWLQELTVDLDAAPLASDTIVGGRV